MYDTRVICATLRLRCEGGFQIQTARDPKSRQRGPPNAGRARHKLDRLTKLNNNSTYWLVTCTWLSLAVLNQIYKVQGKEWPVQCMSMNYSSIQFHDPITVVGNHLAIVKANPTKRRCDYCDRVRRACDKGDPCSSCQHRGIDCTYSRPISESKTRKRPEALEGGSAKRQKISAVNQGI